MKELTSERVNEANGCTALDESVVLTNCKNQGNQQRQYNLASPVKQQHSHTVPRPQPNTSRVKSKPKNERNVQHISNLSCTNTSERQLASSETRSLKWLDHLPLIETLTRQLVTLYIHLEVGLIALIG